MKDVLNQYDPDTKWFAKPAFVKIFVLSTSLFISLFLALAAYGKLVYPSEQLKPLDTWASSIEILGIIFLLTFRHKQRAWLIALVGFSSWCGYAAYWCCVQLPCSCMGASVSFPSAYALSLDVFFICLSALSALLLGVTPKTLYSTFLCAFLFSLIGYAFAEWVFFEKIVGIPWHFW